MHPVGKKTARCDGLDPNRDFLITKGLGLGIFCAAKHSHSNSIPESLIPEEEKLPQVKT